MKVGETLNHAPIRHHAALYIESDERDLLPHHASVKAVSSLDFQDGEFLEFVPKYPSETTSRKRIAVDDDYGGTFVSEAVLLGRKRDSQSLPRYCRPRSYNRISGS